MVDEIEVINDNDQEREKFTERADYHYQTPSKVSDCCQAIYSVVVHNRFHYLICSKCHKECEAVDNGG